MAWSEKRNMTLNGWQRLWVVLGVLWGLCLLVISFTLWPMPSVYLSLDPDAGVASSDGAGVDADKFEATLRLYGGRTINDRVADNCCSQFTLGL